MRLKTQITFIVFSCFLVLDLSGCKKKTANADTGGTACTEHDVKLAINPNNHHFPKQMDKCASDAWGDAKKVSACIKTHYSGLSDACANCFGEMASCSASNCKLACLSDHFSDKCLDCVNTNCRDNKKDEHFSLIQCTGLKPSELPPKK